MKAIIHIGTQKTGTTTIQNWMRLNTEALARQGFRYQPVSKRTYAQMELGLAAVSRAGELFDVPGKAYAMGVERTLESQAAHVAKFEAMLREGVKTWPEPVYIASSEQIHAWCHSEKRMRALHDFLTGIFDEVQYIVYYRPQDDFMLSTYSESVKRGEMLSLQQHIDNQLPKMNFFRRARMWAGVVGHENLTVRLFDRGAFVNGDLVDDFCAVTGIDRAPLQDPPRMNESLNAAQIDFYLKIGRFLPNRRKDGGPHYLYHGLVRLFRPYLKRKPGKVSLSPEQRAHIRATAAPWNEKMRAEWFPERETLFTGW